jgi:hypothetical protein
LRHTDEKVKLKSGMTRKKSV